MPDIFDRVSESKAPAPEGDIFDRVAPTIKAKESDFHAPDLSKLVPTELGGKGGTIQDFGKQVREGLPALGGMYAGIPGAAAGAFTKQALSPDPSITQGGIDTVTQGVIPEALGSLSSFLKDIKTNGLKETIASKLANTNVPFTGKTIGEMTPAFQAAKIINKTKQMLRPESQMVETAAQNTQSNLSPAQQSLAKGTVAEDLSQIPYTQSQIQATPPLSKTADRIFSDVSEVRNAKMATGNPTVIRQLAQDRVLRKNWNFSNGTFNPDNVLNDLGKNEDIYKEAMGSYYDNFVNLMKSAQDLKVGKVPDSIISFNEARKVGALSLAGKIFNIPYQITAPIVLSADAMRKVLSDPALGQLIIAGMKTAKNSQATPILSRAIANGLRGTTLIIKGEDGDQKVQVGDDGTLQTIPPK